MSARYLLTRHRLTISGLVAVVCLGVALGNRAVQAQSDYPMWRGANRDAHAPDCPIATDWKTHPPRLLWKAEGLGKGFASISISNGRLLTTGNTPDSQSVIAVDIATGEVAWTSKITDEAPKHGYEGSRSTPAIDGDRCYVVGSNGEVACLDMADGKVRWMRNFKEWNGRMMSGWGFSESPLVDGEHVLCTPGGPDAMMVCLDKMTGEEVWRSAIPSSAEGGKPGAGYSSIIVSEGAGVKQYVTLVGRGVIGVRASDGKLLWGYSRVANGTANIPTPIAVGDYIFCSSGYGTGSALLKLSAKRGGVEAEEEYFLDGKTLQNHHGGMVRVGDYIYMGHGHNNGFPACVEWKTGKIMWGGKIRGPGSGSAAVIYVNGQLIFRYQSGEVALIEATPDDYRLNGTFTPEVVASPSWSHPVVLDGKLYLREQNTLMCYDITP